MTTGLTIHGQAFEAADEAFSLVSARPLTQMQQAP